MLQFAGNLTYMYSYQSNFHVQVYMTVNQTVKKIIKKCNYLIYTSHPICVHMVLNQVYSAVEAEITWVPKGCREVKFNVNRG